MSTHISTLKKSVTRILNSFGLEIYKIPKNSGAMKSASRVIREPDLAKLDLIRNASLEDLGNRVFLEDLILRLGLNNEMLAEFPKELHSHAGFGLFTWQYPNQLCQLLLKLKEFPVNSYLEIGCRHGGTFLIITEYLRRFNPTFDQAVAVDIRRSEALTKISELMPHVTYLVQSSQSSEFQNFIENNQFDLAFIDGNHSLPVCKADFELLRSKSRMLIFHDIASIECPGVCAVWQHIKAVFPNNYDFYEFIDQYDEVYQRTGNSYLGIGLAVSKAIR